MALELKPSVFSRLGASIIILSIIRVPLIILPRPGVTSRIVLGRPLVVDLVDKARVAFDVVVDGHSAGVGQEDVVLPLGDAPTARLLVAVVVL